MRIGFETEFPLTCQNVFSVTLVNLCITEMQLMLYLCMCAPAGVFVYMRLFVYCIVIKRHRLLNRSFECSNVLMHVRYIQPTIFLLNGQYVLTFRRSELAVFTDVIIRIITPNLKPNGIHHTWIIKNIVLRTQQFSVFLLEGSTTSVSYTHLLTYSQ